MCYKDVIVQEEDLGAAMQKIEIPLKELRHNSIDSVFGLTDEIREIIEDSNLLLEEALYNDDSNDLKPIQNTSMSPTAKRGRFNPPKGPRNKRGRRKRWHFNNAAYLFDSEVDITNKSCSHCETVNTPLWREGPRGAGTLCNACGMRYRMGRLLPEYRPASSPTFKPNMHSNFHRRVMKIRNERQSPPNSVF